MDMAAEAEVWQKLFLKRILTVDALGLFRQSTSGRRIMTVAAIEIVKLAMSQVERRDVYEVCQTAMESALAWTMGQAGKSQIMDGIQKIKHVRERYDKEVLRTSIISSSNTGGGVIGWEFTEDDFPHMGEAGSSDWKRYYRHNAVMEAVISVCRISEGGYFGKVVRETLHALTSTGPIDDLNEKLVEEDSKVGQRLLEIFPIRPGGKTPVGETQTPPELANGSAIACWQGNYILVAGSIIYLYRGRPDEAHQRAARESFFRASPAAQVIMDWLQERAGQL